ncbi:MAG: hypothetical protein JO359_15375 [Candidatus Eremiobacteraeota bacterium]|nr:hypothetical protein [Candidatus Eremiobacteraeota bacterium]
MVTIRVKVGVPVFVRPNVPAVTGAVIRDATVTRDAAIVDVLNTGNVHLSIDTLHVIGESPTGMRTLQADANGWYVLAGGLRRFTLPLKDVRCEDVRTLIVTVRTSGPGLSRTFSDLGGSCGVSAAHRRV